jgi:hypothetical protein
MFYFIVIILQIIATQKRVKINFTLEKAMKAQRGYNGIVLHFNVCSRWGRVVSATSRPPYSREEYTKTKKAKIQSTIF